MVDEFFKNLFQRLGLIFAIAIGMFVIGTLFGTSRPAMDSRTFTDLNQGATASKEYHPVKPGYDKPYAYEGGNRAYDQSGYGYENGRFYRPGENSHSVPETDLSRFDNGGY